MNFGLDFLNVSNCFSEIIVDRTNTKFPMGCGPRIFRNEDKKKKLLFAK